jgi:hypothetical protein
MIPRVASITFALLLISQPAFSDEPGNVRHRHRHAAIYPHVVELVAPPFSAQFVINGYRYDGVAPACRSWVPGQPVRLVSGSWYGDCASATFYNSATRTTCETVCRGSASWWW